MSVDIQIDTAALEEVLGRCGRSMEEISAASMLAGAPDLIDGIMNEFNTAGRGRWPPLAESTLAKRGADAQILMDTGIMRASVGSPEALEASPNELIISAGADYAKFHTSPAARFKIPLRDFFDIDQKYIDRATAIILADALEAALGP